MSTVPTHGRKLHGDDESHDFMLYSQNESQNFRDEHRIVDMDDYDDDDFEVKQIMSKRVPPLRTEKVRFYENFFSRIECLFR